MSDIGLAEDVCARGLYAIQNTFIKVKWMLTAELESALTPAPKGENLFVDADAEVQFRFHLTGDKTSHTPLIREITICGEESLKKKKEDFTDRSGVVAVADIIDGTDLLERNLSNWCSAVVFFKPRNPEGERIIAACVGVPSGKIYYAHADREGAFFKLANGETHPVGGRSSIKKLSQASICFYGQKAKGLSRVAALRLFDYLAEKPKQRSLARTKKNRIYTLAGIPMMMKLIDRQVENAATIDVVFETVGQRPHDVIAGLYIARAQRATVINLDTGKDLTNAEMENALLKPGDEKSKLRYVLAANRKLCDEIVPLLQPKDISPIQPITTSSRPRRGALAKA